MSEQPETIDTKIPPHMRKGAFAEIFEEARESIGKEDSDPETANLKPDPRQMAGNGVPVTYNGKTYFVQPISPAIHDAYAANLETVAFQNSLELCQKSPQQASFWWALFYEMKNCFAFTWGSEHCEKTLNTKEGQILLLYFRLCLKYKGFQLKWVREMVEAQGDNSAQAAWVVGIQAQADGPISPK